MAEFTLVYQIHRCETLTILLEVVSCSKILDLSTQLMLSQLHIETSKVKIFLLGNIYRNIFIEFSIALYALCV